MSLKLSPGCKCCDAGDVCVCGDPVQMILIFIDEAESIYSPSGTTAWDADETDWDNTVTAFGQPDYTQLCQVWQDGETTAPVEATSVCKPTSRDLPDNWTFDTLVRSPTEAECKAVYDSAKGGAGVAHPTDLVFLGVDNSGSMTLDTLGAGFSDFKDYLTAQGVRWRQVLFDSERWVLLAADNYEATADSSTPDEIDVELYGLSNGSDCTICEDLVGTFALADPEHLTDADGRFDSDGWSGDAWSRTADVPSGTTEACVWKYVNIDYCSWEYSAGSSPPLDDIVKRFDIRGLLIARFKISASEYIWRIIVLYELSITCTVMGSSSSDSVNSGWYWEFNDTAQACGLTGSETWSANFPSAVPLLNVFCSDSHEASFSDYCGGTLTLSSAVNG